MRLGAAFISVLFIFIRLFYVQLFSLIKIWAYDKTWWNLSTWKSMKRKPLTRNKRFQEGANDHVKMYGCCWSCLSARRTNSVQRRESRNAREKPVCITYSRRARSRTVFSRLVEAFCKIGVFFHLSLASGKMITIILITSKKRRRNRNQN